LAYQLDFWAVVKAVFVPFDLVFHAIVIGAFGIGPVVILLQLRKGTPFRKLRLPFALVVGLPVAASLVICLLHTGAGWQLADKELQVKTGVWGAEEIKLAQARVALVESRGPWTVKLRTGGLGLPGLSTGRFKFQNGETALYFRHLDSPRRVVLESGGRYYVIAHPRVEKLYEELVARGAQPAKL
jgi:hypothetical protein